MVLVIFMFINHNMIQILFQVEYMEFPINVFKIITHLMGIVSKIVLLTHIKMKLIIIVPI